MTSTSILNKLEEKVEETPEKLKDMVAGKIVKELSGNQKKVLERKTGKLR